jgi:hypothetical protein
VERGNFDGHIFFTKNSLMRILILMLLGWSNLGLHAQSSLSYSEEIAEFREAYKHDFLLDERAPLKTGEDLAKLRFFEPDERYRVRCAFARTQEAMLNEVADSESPMRGYARAILMLLKDKHYECEHPLVERSARFPKNEEPDAEPATKWTVAPNPANHSVRIDFGRETAEDAVLTLFDIHGRLILKMDIPYMVGATIDTKAFPEGIYLAVLREHGKPTDQSRFAVQH